MREWHFSSYFNMKSESLIVKYESLRMLKILSVVFAIMPVIGDFCRLQFDYDDQTLLEWMCASAPFYHIIGNRLSFDREIKGNKFDYD